MIFKITRIPGKPGVVRAESRNGNYRFEFSAPPKVARSMVSHPTCYFKARVTGDNQVDFERRVKDQTW